MSQTELEMITGGVQHEGSVSPVLMHRIEPEPVVGEVISLDEPGQAREAEVAHAVARLAGSTQLSSLAVQAEIV